MATELTETKTYCAYHPDRETSLQCNRCGKFICAKCAKRVAIGYRCVDCLKQQQQTFETAVWYDYVLTVILAALLTFLGGLIIPSLGFFMILLAPLAGGVIAEVIFRALRKHRSKYIPWLALAGVALGGAPSVLLPILFFMLSVLNPRGGWSITSLLPLLWTLGYLFLCGSTLYYRLRGIRIN